MNPNPIPHHNLGRKFIINPEGKTRSQIKPTPDALLEKKARSASELNEEERELKMQLKEVWDNE